MEPKIIFRAVIEVAGRPQEYVQSALKEYLENLQKDKKFTVLHQELAAIEKQDEQELWATFAEVEIKTSAVGNIISFCFDYMPSVVDILEPEVLNLNVRDLSFLFNDLQARLHQVDMVAKQLRLENEHQRKNTQDLLGNYIIVILRSQNLTSAQLSHLTGVNQDQLEDFLDQLIDQKKIDLKEGIYYLREKELEQ